MSGDIAQHSCRCSIVATPCPSHGGDSRRCRGACVRRPRSAHAASRTGTHIATATCARNESPCCTRSWSGSSGHCGVASGRRCSSASNNTASRPCVACQRHEPIGSARGETHGGRRRRGFVAGLMSGNGSKSRQKTKGGRPWLCFGPWRSSASGRGVACRISKRHTGQWGARACHGGAWATGTCVQEHSWTSTSGTCCAISGTWATIGTHPRWMCNNTAWQQREHACIVVDSSA
jgi:hypothetical protein